jgi:hypothetical protein
MKEEEVPNKREREREREIIRGGKETCTDFFA